MKILALDLGTLTGYALEAPGYPGGCGTWKLATDAELRRQKLTRGDRRGDIRFTNLVRHLRYTCECLRVDMMVFEDVQFASTSMQAHLWASLRAAVWLMGDEFKVRVDCCPVGTLKRFATGNGGAKKDAMAAALVAKHDRFFFRGDTVVDGSTNVELDDNAVDALHLLDWAKSLLK